MKKNYIKPQVEVVKVKMGCQILADSNKVNSVKGNVFNFGGGSNRSARSRKSNMWEEDDDEEEE